MKKVLSFLIFGILLIVLITPEIVSAQTPKKCIELGSNINWTGNVDGKNCTTATCGAAPCKYCLFKSTYAVGEEINAGDCGEAAAITKRCDDTAAPPWTVVGDHLEQNASCITNLWGILSLLNGLNKVTNWIFIVLIIVVGLLIIWGGVSIATAGGDPQKAKSGRDIIMYALIGFAIALLSKALPAVVKALLGV